jgi:hypothetical protein
MLRFLEIRNYWYGVAGEGVGILAGAVIGSMLGLSAPTHIALEYVLGFAFGWTIFQALFMRGMAGGSFSRALRQTFIPEFLSMNALIAGMVPVMTLTMASVPGSDSPRGAIFWFFMSMALLVGGIIAYPMNWWLVARHLKHGMMTVRRVGAAEAATSVKSQPVDHDKMGQAHGGKPSKGTIVTMAVLSIAIFGLGIALSALFGGFH